MLLLMISLTSSTTRSRLSHFLSFLARLQAQLRLDYNALSGPLPSEIGRLTRLRTHLDASANSLTGALPSQLGQIRLLQSHLGLGGNRFSAELPSELGLLTGLTAALGLQSNGLLCGAVPPELGALSEAAALANPAFDPSEDWRVEDGNPLLGRPCGAAAPPADGGGEGAGVPATGGGAAGDGGAAGPGPVGAAVASALLVRFYAPPRT